MRYPLQTLVIVLGLGCSDSTGDADVRGPTNQEQILRVAVLQDGTISMDGAPVSLANLRDRLTTAAGTDTVVWYYREAGQSDPPEEAMLVIKAITDNRLPVSLSSEPDFSTVVLPDGTIKTR